MKYLIFGLIGTVACAGLVCVLAVMGWALVFVKNTYGDVAFGLIAGVFVWFAASGLIWLLDPDR